MASQELIRTHKELIDRVNQGFYDHLTPEEATRQVQKDFHTAYHFWKIVGG